MTKRGFDSLHRDIPYRPHKSSFWRDPTKSPQLLDRGQRTGHSVSPEQQLTTEPPFCRMWSVGAVGTRPWVGANPWSVVRKAPPLTMRPQKNRTPGNRLTKLTKSIGRPLSIEVTSSDRMPIKMCSRPGMWPFAGLLARLDGSQHMASASYQKPRKRRYWRYC